MPNPTLPVTHINALEADPGLTFIELRSTIQFLDAGDKAAFIAHLGIVGGDIEAADITDSTAAGRTLLTAANAAAQKTALAIAIADVAALQAALDAKAATAYVDSSIATAVANLINSAPGALDTLDELAAAFGDDANFAATMTTALAGKAPTTRTITAAGLATGGGDLSANRTITVPVASQPEAEAGTDNTKAMTPLATAAAIAALAAGGSVYARVLHVAISGGDYTALSAAKAAAVAGDLVVVHPGSYIVTDSILKDGVDWHCEPGVTITRTHTPTKSTATLVVSGFGQNEGSTELTDGANPYSVTFVNIDISPAGGPVGSNGVVYFTNADNDASILTAWISALTTGTGTTPSATPNAAGTIDPKPKCAGTSALTSYNNGGGTALSLVGALTGFSVADGVTGQDDYIGIIDDAGAALTSTITGQAVLVSDLTAYQTDYTGGGVAGQVASVSLSGASVVRIEVDRLSGGGNSGAAYGSGLFTGGDSNVIFRANAIAGYDYAVWWEASETTVNCTLLSSRKAAVWLLAVSAANLFVTAETLEVIGEAIDYAGTVSGTGGSAEAAAWITAKTVKGLPGTPVLQSYPGMNKIYVNCQKIVGFIVASQGLLYVQTEKHVPVSATTLIQAVGGHLFYRAAHIDVTGFACPLLSSGGAGIAEVEIGSYIGHATSTGITVTDSTATLNLINSHIDTSANSAVNAITVTDGTVNVRGCVLKSHASKKDIARTAGTVNVAGGSGTATGGNLTTSGTVNIIVPSALLARTDLAQTFTGTQTFATGITMADTANLVASTTGTGTKIGTATTQLLGFWNKTPIVQPAAALQAALTNSTGGTQDGTLVDVATAAIADPAKINSNFTDVHALLGAIRTALVNAGIIKGAA